MTAMDACGQRLNQTGSQTLDHLQVVPRYSLSASGLFVVLLYIAVAGAGSMAHHATVQPEDAHGARHRQQLPQGELNTEHGPLPGCMNSDGHH